jgi:hypothetical protein
MDMNRLAEAGEAACEKLSAPRRGEEHYNQIDPSINVRKALDATVRGAQY